ncbi:glycoside hydrolase family 32 protein [uncultured Clostridium sp.]|uniref:glycoside hydrolase family 32 protein n=1 Tax=uncultured Clostridium sp. TaxID=59620 RepID=UPI0028E46775|nr:glycoside hydrolase family 32 protein [uncultured Clostridium sp.]
MDNIIKMRKSRILIYFIMIIIILFTMIFSKIANAEELTNQSQNIANLTTDFGAQGNNGWYYGYGTSNVDFTLASSYDDSSKKYYQLGLDGLELHSDFVHPAASNGAIYKWVVGVTGKINLAGSYTKFKQADSNPSWPDGIKLKIFLNGQVIKEDSVQVSNSIDIVETININSISVTQGDNIYFVVTANNNNAWDGGKLDVSITPAVYDDLNIVYDDQNIFPKSQQSNLSFVGDPMPYYENGKFNIFYLDDIRDQIENGFHPWSLMQTDNLYNYTNQGKVINHSNDNLDQDLALGTGSVMKDKNGLYHAFFTGFNDRRADVVSQLNKANLASDFGVQGSNRWSYGYGTSNADFTLATGYDAASKKYYQSGLDGLELHPDFVQPSASKGAIYRWTAGETGKIDLTGTYTKYTQNNSNPSWPDGVTLTIYRNDEILQRDVVPVSNLVQNVDKIKIEMVKVNQGDNIYFVITANNNNAWDGGKLDVSINPTEIANEAIMHATSTDLKNWTKIYNDTFFASAQYSKNDFRDPYVFYNQDDNKYWMLITTRKNDTGVIAKYVSDDLKNWTDQGVFFTNDMNTSNLECPTLIKYGSYWYLTFSDQSTADPYGNRVVHYRKASSINGPFTKPDRDSFDGNGFYAGKLEKDSSNNLFLFGWTPTKVGYNDANAYDWAGNLVVHQIKQNTNGDLYVTPVQSVVNKIYQQINLTQYDKTSTVTKNNNDYSFSGNGYESVTFNEISGTNKITGKINTKSKNNNFGFMFNVGENGKAPLNIVFNHQYGRLEFYNASTDASLGQLQSTKLITVPDNGILDFTILINDSVAVLYVNNEAAFSTRMYDMQNHKWGIFSMDSDATFSNIQLSK